MKPDLPGGLADLGADLEKLDPDRIHLGRFKLGFFQVPSEQQEQAVRQGVKQKPKLIGFEAMAAEAISLELVFQFLDPVFRLAPLGVDPIVDNMRLKPQIRHHEALIEPFFQPLHFGHDPA